MHKKYQKIIFMSVALVIVYLYLAHTTIYRRMGYAHLLATDNRHAYILGNVISGQQKIVYAALGDSLTSGVGTNKYEQAYPYLVAAYLAGTDKVIEHLNFSYPGARTENLIRDLLRPTIAAQPDVVTVLIGVNDVHGFVSEAQFRKNYEYIVRELTTKTRAKIYLVGIPNIGSHTLILPPYNYIFESRGGTFDAVIQDLAKTYNLQYIDLTTPTAAVLKQDGPYYSADSFHPSALGYASWAKIIYDGINQ